MIGFPWLLLVVGLLAVALCLLRETGYLEVDKFPSDLGWWAQMVNAGHTFGWRAQYERYPAGARFLARFYPPFLCWPATLRVVLFHRLSIHLYLGARKEAEPPPAE